ncbi:hypothetical protein P368_02970 [Comamonas thiooxydans]|nr:hypothetical protein P367_24750 [Comamonas thiooxydans]KGG95406.1 hypothetical protein P369_02960 [Comamonas thiooxydans]KGH07889.1 hypothetical protein P365_03970 [Comamonas thiooxydans]KGH15418.1 hypothetical protein P368_02970 [Comamonas thiooxydans]
MTKTPGIDTQDGLLLKTLQSQFPQFRSSQGRELRLYRSFVPGLDESHRFLSSQEDLQGAAIGCQPILKLDARRCVSPIASKDESLAFWR